MIAIASAGAGFLLAVLWFDLMFDVQSRGRSGGELPEGALSSVAGYYARVTTAAHPMGLLVAAVMIATLGALVGQIIDAVTPSLIAWASLGLAGGPILLVAARTRANAVRLGTRADPIATQSALARSILRDHVFCLVSIVALLVLQLAAA